MVLKGRIQSGFIGYDAKNIPRARRSVRKRILCKKTIGDDQLCAFELLAAVAGKLLQESETSSASSSAAVAVDNHNIGKEVIKKAPRNRMDKATRPEQEEPGSSEESGVSSALGLQKCTQKDFCKEARDVSCEVNVKQIAQVSTSSCFVKGSSDAKPIAHSSIDKFKKLSSEEGGASPNCRESSNTIVYNEIARCHKVNGAMSEVLGVVEKFSSKDCVVSCGNLSSPVHSGYKANLAPRRGSTPDSVNAKYKNDMNIDSRDDDEILSQLSGRRSQGKVHQSPTNVEDCRISKLLTSKYWNSAPKLKDYKPINSGGSKRRKIYPDGISCYDREMLQHSTPFKKRKLFGQSSVVTYDGGISGESASNSNEKEVHYSNNSPTKSCAGNKMSLSSMDHQRSFNSRNSPVKLSINSLMVPELLVEVPESSTVASLKKTVMDAITTVLGGGLRVGMLLNGKKIRDDSRTLLQSGISENDNLDDLDFILEPSSSKQISSKHPHENPLVMPACTLPKYYINRPLIPKQELPPLEISDKTAVTDSSRVFQDLVPFSTPELENNPASDCKALVVVPENAEVLDVVPMSSKPRRSEIGQRRIRRPFSVTEVEALVQAVEKLGTGRWRDVKLAAFENAKHRTYVDLKDKWKTLVHTAKIAPQQRRGEPVPQALLDRVLAAHAHWCQHQAKQKQVHSDESGMLKLSDPLAQKVAA